MEATISPGCPASGVKPRATGVVWGFRAVAPISAGDGAIAVRLQYGGGFRMARDLLSSRGESTCEKDRLFWGVGATRAILKPHSYPNAPHEVRTGWLNRFDLPNGVFS